MEETVKRPSVGVGVLILRSGQILLGQRKNAHGDGTWAPPGGHLEWNESLEDCAKREVMEETGLDIENIRQAAFTNDVFSAEGKHYVTLFLLADCPSGEPEIKEPEKCTGWKWFSWDELPRPLFLPLQHIFDQAFDPRQ